MKGNNKDSVLRTRKVMYVVGADQLQESPTRLVACQVLESKHLFPFAQEMYPALWGEKLPRFCFSCEKSTCDSIMSVKQEAEMQ